MICKKILILSSLLALPAIGVTNESRNDYAIIIEHGVLKSVEKLEDTEKLDLSNHGIREIKDGVFKDVGVKTLNLESNEISILEPGAFSGLGENLEELNLGSNQIKFIDSSFVGLKNLKLLNFSNNPLVYLIPGNFAGIPQTADIIVEGNEIQYLSRWIFEEPIAHPSSKDYDDEIDYIDYIDNDIDVDDDDDYGDVDVADDDEDNDDDSDDDVFHDAGDHNYNNRVIICIENSILKKVGILKENEPLSEDCEDSITNRGIHSNLKLRNREIKDVVKGWYQMQQIPITFIDLSRNNLTEVSPELLNDLPNSVKVVDLSHNLIRQIKRDTINNTHLEVLIFKTNLIENVEDESFESSNISKLYFTDNKISDIGFAASLPANLNMLHLNKNEILFIKEGVFSRLENVKRLDLTQNRITKIRINAFHGLTSLKSLILARNEISEIEADAFSGLRNLRRISFNYNLISSCKEGVFNGLENLRDLRFEKNKFTNISKNNFARLPDTLMSLNLNDNEITDIESGFFVGVPKSTLKLTNNKLSKLLPVQFEIDELDELHLENNSITEISPDSFQGLSSVKYLSLADNQISEIPSGIARHFNASINIDISRNPITKLQNGALHGIPKSHVSALSIAENKLVIIQGGIFENI